MSEAQYVKLIPPDELATINAFLRDIHAARGFGAGSYGIREAWDAALAAAWSPDGGEWSDELLPSALTAEMLQSLAAAIDDAFFGGQLHSRCAGASGAERIAYRVIDHCVYDVDWIAYFDYDSNAVYYNRSKWAQPVDGCCPMECEGVVCNSKLEVVAHTIAHELVHALVFHLFPKIDDASPAYNVNGRHGPIFCLLNKKLFGHVVDSFRAVHAGGTFRRFAGS